MRFEIHNKQIKNNITPGISLVLALFLALMSACAPTEDSIPAGLNISTADFETTSGPIDQNINPESSPGGKLNECPALDSLLLQLVNMDDASDMAAKLGYQVKENKIQVLLILESEDLAFLSDFDAEIGSQTGKQVQAFVGFDQLCPLARHDAVLAVRPVAQASP